MSSGSWFRYIVGILLSLDVLRVAITSKQIEMTTIILAIVFLLLAGLYLVKRI